MNKTVLGWGWGEEGGGGERWGGGVLGISVHPQKMVRLQIKGEEIFNGIHDTKSKLINW